MITIILHVITKQFQILILSQCCWITHNSLLIYILIEVLINQYVRRLKAVCEIFCVTSLWLTSVLSCDKQIILSKKEMFLYDRIKGSNDIVCSRKVNDYCCHSAFWRSVFWLSVCFVFCFWVFVKNIGDETEEEKRKKKEWTPHSFSLMEALQGQYSVH